MPHEYLEFEKVSTDGLMLSAGLLQDFREAENAAQIKESKKSPKAREGTKRAQGMKSSHTGRLKNLPKKK